MIFTLLLLLDPIQSFPFVCSRPYSCRSISAVQASDHHPSMQDDSILWCLLSLEYLPNSLQNTWSSSDQTSLGTWGEYLEATNSRVFALILFWPAEKTWRVTGRKGGILSWFNDACSVELSAACWFEQFNFTWCWRSRDLPGNFYKIRYVRLQNFYQSVPIKSRPQRREISKGILRGMCCRSLLMEVKLPILPITKTRGVFFSNKYYIIWKFQINKDSPDS